MQLQLQLLLSQEDQGRVSAIHCSQFELRLRGSLAWCSAWRGKAGWGPARQASVIEATDRSVTPRPESGIPTSGLAAAPRTCFACRQCTAVQRDAVPVW